MKECCARLLSRNIVKIGKIVEIERRLKKMIRKNKNFKINLWKWIKRRDEKVKIIGKKQK